MAPKIYSLHPLVAGRLQDWPIHFARIAAMGFNHVCLAPPFLPGRSGDIYACADPDQLHPALEWEGNAAAGLAWAATEAAEAGLHLLLDIVIDQVAIGSRLHDREPTWFLAGGYGALPDPRQAPRRSDLAYARLDQAEAAEALVTWWKERLASLLRAGLTGFRFLRPDRPPAHFWRQLLRDVRAVSGHGRFMAWTAGLSRPSIRALEGCGFDLAAVSTMEWNGKGSSFAEGVQAARRLAPVVFAPEPSFLHRLATNLPPGRDPVVAYRHAIRVAGAFGDGVFVPMGFEHVTRRIFDAARAGPRDFALARDDALADISDDIADANALADRLDAMGPRGGSRQISAASSSTVAWLRYDADDVRQATRAILVEMNPDLVHPAPALGRVSCLPPSAGAAFGRPYPVEAAFGLEALLAPGEVRVIAFERLPDIVGADAPGAVERSAVMHGRIGIEAIAPAVPGGTFAVKRIAGESVDVFADIIADGHDVLAADLLWRPADENAWQRVAMTRGVNDRWHASFTPDRVGLYHFTVEAWWDRWGTFHHDLQAKYGAGQTVGLEIQEGLLMVREAVARAAGPARTALQDALDQASRLSHAEQVALLLSDPVASAMQAADERPFATRHTPPLQLRADRPQAAFASWYELFPRSATDDPSRHGTFADVIQRLPDIAAMGFDVLYFPPIHPIGMVNRKGRNNSLRAEPGDVGSPYAIGGAQGGHDALHPALGTLDDFRRLIAAAHEYGLELAMDFAVQCAPDHPWLREHPDWFRWRPDGSMRYAENPPKKYEDIVNPDFYADAALPPLWFALRDVIQFWVDQGVNIFRVDNPHTKPLPFWQWMIADIQSRTPGALFLSEAFTRPKLMYRLAKIGFTQSYTYFTWRNTKQEITEYLTELAAPPVVDFFRPNFFVNTPDINPFFLQTSGRPGFLTRAALATTLSGLWGMYSGFEICEAQPLPGREEYLDSEKYEIRPRDYGAPGNIVAEITRLNLIRRAHRALQTHAGVQFHHALNNQVILYSKRMPDEAELVLVAVSFDPQSVQEADIEIPLWLLGLPDHAAVAVEDLMREHDFVWHGKSQRIRLDPGDLPFAIWRLSPVGVA